jgi:hypothetical protein
LFMKFFLFLVLVLLLMKLFFLACRQT